MGLGERPEAATGIAEALDALLASLDDAPGAPATHGLRAARDEIAAGLREPEADLVRVALARAAHATEQAAVEAAVTRQERDLERIAERLHDDPIQQLTAAQLSADVAAIGGDPDRAAVEELAELLRSATRALRGLLGQLHPELATVGDLAEALRDLAAGRGAAREAVTVAWDLAEPPPAVLLTLLRAADLLVDNVLRHAEALTAVRVEGDAASVSLVVADRGSGGCPASPPSGGGLDAASRRVGLHGGELHVDSGPSGTRVRAWIPLEDTVRRAT